MNRPMTIRLWWALLAVLLSCLVMTVGSMLYANRVAARSGQNWCDVIITLDDAYRQAPPQTPTGQKLAREMHDLKVRLRCT